MFMQIDVLCVYLILTGLSYIASFLFTRLVPNMFPNYIRAPNGAEAKPVSQLQKGQSSLTEIVRFVQYKIFS